jgi:hypothetical protein
VHFELRSIQIKALFKYTFGLAHEPGLHGIADTLGRGVLRQTDVQGEAGHSGQGGVGGLCVGVQLGLAVTWLATLCSR